MKTGDQDVDGAIRALESVGELDPATEALRTLFLAHGKAQLTLYQGLLAQIEGLKQRVGHLEGRPEEVSH